MSYAPITTGFSLAFPTKLAGPTSKSSRGRSATGAPLLAVLSLIFLDTLPQSAADGAIASEAPAPAVQVTPAPTVPPPIPDEVSVGVEKLPIPAPIPVAEARQARAAKAITPGASHRHLKLSAGNLCLNPGTDRACEATFTQALRTDFQPTTASENDVLVTATGTADVVGMPGAEPLHFQKRAPWVRRLETLGKEGIPFVRIPQGPENELVVGINRKGLLGFSLKPKKN